MRFGDIHDADELERDSAAEHRTADARRGVDALDRHHAPALAEIVLADASMQQPAIS